MIALSEPIDVRMRCGQLLAQVRARTKHRVVPAIAKVDDMVQAELLVLPAVRRS